MSALFRYAPGTAPVLVNVPHAGTYVPPEILGRFAPAAGALPDTDWHVDRLYEFAGRLGLGLLAATHSRYVVDLNRDPSGAGLYPGADNTELVPLSTFERQPVYRPGQAPDAAEIAARIGDYWQPYHARLKSELDGFRQRFGIAVLWDAHSIRSQVPRFFAGRLPDFNLGSARGTSADPELIARVKARLAAAPGFTSVLDGRFTGGYITRAYGRPRDGVHALQLEMAQASYMDEAPPYPFLAERARRVEPVLSECLASVLAWLRERP
ncbi:MAG: N-formylglutamate deformylase [Pseudomonadota bacterium]